MARLGAHGSALVATDAADERGCDARGARGGASPSIKFAADAAARGGRCGQGGRTGDSAEKRGDSGGPGDAGGTGSARRGGGGGCVFAVQGRRCGGEVMQAGPCLWLAPAREASGARGARVGPLLGVAMGGPARLSWACQQAPRSRDCCRSSSRGAVKTLGRFGESGADGAGPGSWGRMVGLEGTVQAPRHTADCPAAATPEAAVHPPGRGAGLCALASADPPSALQRASAFAAKAAADCDVAPCSARGSAA